MALLKANEHLFLCHLVEFGSDLSGRSVYLGYPGHLWVHGIDYYEREQQVKDILAGNIKIIDQLEEPVKFIVIVNNNLSRSGLNQVYSNQKFYVLKIR